LLNDIENTGEYAVIKHETKIPIDVARRIVKEEVVEEKKSYWGKKMLPQTAQFGEAIL
jgi:hypothetical protein